MSQEYCRDQADASVPPFVLESYFVFGFFSSSTLAYKADRVSTRRFTIQSKHVFVSVRVSRLAVHDNRSCFHVVSRQDKAIVCRVHVIVVHRCFVSLQSAAAAAAVEADHIIRGW